MSGRPSRRSWCRDRRGRAVKSLWIAIVARLPLGEITVRIRGGRAEAVRGRVRAGLLAALGDLARSSGVRSACLHASRGSTSAAGGWRLSFHGVPRSLRQRFRNLWITFW
jgi:hypothetical protein